MVAVGGAGILQLSRGTGQLRGPADVPTGGGSYVAGGAPASQPARSPFVGAVPSDPGSLPASAAHSASLAMGSLRRHAPEVRAVCARVRSYGSVRGVVSNDRPYRDWTRIASRDASLNVLGLKKGSPTTPSVCDFFQAA